MLSLAASIEALFTAGSSAVMAVSCSSTGVGYQPPARTPRDGGSGEPVRQRARLRGWLVRAMGHSSVSRALERSKAEPSLRAL
jgi:hypothetical protein